MALVLAAGIMAGKKKIGPGLIGALLLGSVVIIIAVLQAGRRASPDGAPSLGEDSALASESSGRAAVVRVNAIRADETKPPERTSSRTTETASVPEPEQTPAYEPVEVKRSFRSDNFQNPDFSLDGYRLEGLVRTEKGITLAPAEKKEGAPDDEEAEVRKGVIESPTLPLEFPSNFMMPLWRQHMTEGGNLTVEMGISPDGQDWSRWFPLEPNSDEIEPTYPDGRPNPNYGFVGGNGIANGTRLYPFARYRVTMTSGDPQTAPVLEEFKIYHVDSTGPDGALADKAYSGMDQPSSQQGNQP